MIEFVCSDCGFSKGVPDEYAGKKVICPKCKAKSLVAAEAQIPTTASVDESQFPTFAPVDPLKSELKTAKQSIGLKSPLFKSGVVAAVVLIGVVIGYPIWLTFGTQAQPKVATSQRQNSPDDSPASSDTTKPPKASAAKSKAFRTAEIMETILKIETACMEDTLRQQESARRAKDNDPRRNAFLKALATVMSDVEKLKESIYEHSEFKNPKIDEIRHDELNHDELNTKLDAIVKSVSVALDAYRERRTPDRWGSIAGKALISEIPPPRKAFVDNNTDDESLQVNSSNRGIANAVVYVKIKPSKIHKDLMDNMPKELVCELKGNRFTPRVSTWNTDQQLKLTMSDPDSQHIKLSMHPNNRVIPEFSLRKGATRSIWPSEPDLISARGIGTAEGFWVVTNNPYATLTRDDGSFEISKLPVGEHTIEIAHERVKGSWTWGNPATVTVEADKTTEIPEITIPISALWSH